jgi:protein O-mannosyl-transferase
VPIVPAKTSSPKDGDLFSSPEKRTLILGLLLAMLTLALYNPVSHFQFLNFDDDEYVTNNLHVQAGLNWDTVSWAFRSTEAVNWHPLTWISHAVDCQLFHLNPAGHHYVNVLLHACNVVLLFLLLQRGTGRTWRSLTVAALFAVHPINVESVAWVAERKNVLCTLFFLLALGAYGWYVRKPALKRYLVVVLLFALGLMSKPMVITLPFVLLLLDYWPLRRMNFSDAGESESKIPHKAFSWLLLEKIPLLALSAASAIVTMMVQSNGNAVKSDFSLPVRLGNAIASYGLYVLKAVWPLPLAAFYPHERALISGWTVVVSAIFLVAVTVGVLKLRGNRYLSVGWLWFLGTLVPVIGLVQVGGQAMADRYAYIPFIGLLVAFIWGVADWAGARKISTIALAAGGFAFVFAFSAITRVQESYWHDSVSLWSHTIAVTGPNFVAQDNLGVALVSLGKVDEANPHFQAAVQINPLDPIGQLNVGVDEQLHGKVRESIGRYQIVLQQTLDPRFEVYAFENLGSAYRALGEYAHARDSFGSALQLAPADTFALVGLGVVAQKTGDFSRAAEYYARAVQIKPSDIGYLLLAQALQQTGQAADAQAALEQAQKLSANLDQARQRMNRLLTE